MKISKFVEEVKDKTDEMIEFDGTNVQVQNIGDGEIRLYAGDGNSANDFVYLNRASIHRVSKMLKRLAESL